MRKRLGKRILSTVLAAVLAVSSISIPAKASELDSYQDEVIATSTDAEELGEVSEEEISEAAEAPEAEAVVEDEEVVYDENGEVYYRRYFIDEVEVIDFGDNEVPIEGEEESVDMAEEADYARDYSVYHNDYSYNKMTSTQKKVADQIFAYGNKLLTTTTNVTTTSLGYYVSSVITVPTSWSSTDMSQMLKATLYQRPEFYFLQIGIVYQSGKMYIKVYDAFVNGSTRMSYTNTIFNRVEGWVNEIKNANFESQWKTELACHDKVVRSVTYKDGTYSQSIFSSVYQGYTVCAGYAKLYAMLANACGIPTVSVSGSVPGGNHAWNESQLYGNWLVVDCTWDDPDSGSSVKYNYFNKTQAQVNSAGGTRTILSCMKSWIPSTPYTYNSTAFYPKGIYVARCTYEGASMGASVDYNQYSLSQMEYQWQATCDGGNTWKLVQDWTRGNNWVDVKPYARGNCIVVCRIRPVGYSSMVQQLNAGFEYNYYIKDICQLPYTGKGGGFLLGFSSFDNPNNSYQYEILILDLSLYAQGKDAWVFNSGRNKINGTTLWTVWQPQYGYYLTMYRLYDGYGNLLQELCYGFQNI